MTLKLNNPFMRDKPAPTSHPETGRRALVLFLAWAVVVALSGGDELPFWNALAPALPLAFIAIQSAITNWMDARPRHAPVAIALLGITVPMSFLASKLPGDLGPIPMKRFLDNWMAPSETAERSYEGDCMLPRGVYTIGPTGVRVSDPFGWSE